MEEIWKPILDYPGYDVSNLGNVRSWKRYGVQHGKLDDEPHLLTPAGGGRPPHALHVMLSRNAHSEARLVHRLVLTAFVGPCPPGMEACHNDGNYRNNGLDNLRWDMHLSNEQDKIRHGHSGKGEQNSQAKLTPKQVLEIRERYANGESPNALAVAFHVWHSAITRIVTGQRWWHLGGPLHEPGADRGLHTPHGKNNYFGQHPEISRGVNNTKAILTERQVLEIRSRYAQGERRKDLALEYGVSRHNIDHIVTRISWKHLP